MAKLRLEGSFVALITPFNRDGSIDFEAFRALVKFQRDNGTRAMLDHLRTNPDGEMDIERFVSGSVLQESATPPGPTEVADPLLELLRPEGAYRLVWQVPSADRP